MATRERELDVLFWAKAAVMLPEGAPGAGPHAPQVVAAYEAVARSEAVMQRRLMGPQADASGTFGAVLSLAAAGVAEEHMDGDGGNGACGGERDEGAPALPGGASALFTQKAPLSSGQQRMSRTGQLLLRKWRDLGEQGRRLWMHLFNPRHCAGDVTNVESSYRVAAHLADALTRLERGVHAQALDAQMHEAGRAEAGRGQKRRRHQM